MKFNASLFSILTVITLVFSGCTTPVAIDPIGGEPQVANYTAGFFYAPIDQDARDIFRVAIREMDEMGYFRTGELHRDTSITIYARKVGDDKVTVRIKQIEAGNCELRIRVGETGNLAESQAIYNRIRDAI